MFITNLKSRISLRFLSIIFAGLVIVALTSAVSSAEEWSRKGKSEIYLPVQYMTGDSTTALGMTIEMGNTITGGLGIGYNFNDYVNVNLEQFFGGPDFTAKSSNSTDKADTFLYGGNINLDINILKSAFTPLITGGVGFMRFNGDWENGLPFDETDFSYNAGGGFRWDVTNKFLIKACYRATWTKIEDSDKPLMFNTAVLSIGYIF